MNSLIAFFFFFLVSLTDYIVIPDFNQMNSFYEFIEKKEKIPNFSYFTGFFFFFFFFKKDLAKIENIQDSFLTPIFILLDSMFYPTLRLNIYYNWDYVGVFITTSQMSILLVISSSSCRAASTDIPDPLSPLLPIIHRFWQVFRVTSHILT